MNKIKIYFSLVFIFMVLASHSYSQKSNIYSTNGELLFDPTYSINSNRLDDFSKIELYILSYIYSNTYYPDTALWNGISSSVIAKVIIDRTGKGNVKIVESSGYTFFDKSVIIAINESMNVLKRYTKSMKLPFEFYIPFQFNFVKDSFREDLKRNNAVTIKDRGVHAPITPVKE